MRSFIRFLLLVCLALNTSVVWAADGVPESRMQITYSFAPVVKKVAPAVVNIYTRKMVKQRMISPFMDDPIFQQFFGLPQHGQTRERMEKSLGSGVIVREDGLIVTNNHVIAGADQITVILHDRHEYEATLITADERSDLAVLRINPKEKNLPFLELADSDVVEVGDLVLAIGNPFGVGQTVTNGIVSAMARTAVDINDLNYFIQTDAAINPGNSGGALVSMNGKLVGINSAIFTRSGGNMGIGFAIPSNMVRAIVKAVTEGKKSVVRPWTGLSGQEVTAELATSLNLPQPTGMLINEIHHASPAKKADLRVGDVVVSVNDKPVESPDAFRYRIAMLPVGTTASLEVVRKGQNLGKVSLDLIAPPEVPSRDKTLLKGNNPLAGATVVNISPAVTEELGLHNVEHGVVVINVNDTSVAASLGLRPGDMIIGVNGEEITTVSDVLAKTQARVARWRVAIRRGDQVVNMLVGG